MRYIPLSHPTLAVLARPLAATALIGALFLPVHAQLPAEQHDGGIAYVTGGFGIDESTAIKQAMDQYTLALTMAQEQGDGRAAYLSNAQVVIRDASDHTVLNTAAKGPFLLAQVPPGRYQLHVTYQQHTISRELAIQAGATTRVNLLWPARQP